MQACVHAFMAVSCLVHACACMHIRVHACACLHTPMRPCLQGQEHTDHAHDASVYEPVLPYYFNGRTGMRPHKHRCACMREACTHARTHLYVLVCTRHAYVHACVDAHEPAEKEDTSTSQVASVALDEAQILGEEIPVLWPWTCLASDPGFCCDIVGDRHGMIRLA